MIVRKCTHCEDSTQDALTWTVWAWMKADGHRVAYKQKLCLTCVSTTLAPLYTACQEPSMTCPNCGISTEDDMDPVYATFIPKGLGKLHIEAPTCPSCAVKLRMFAEKGGERLEDRDQGIGGQVPGPRSNSADYWVSIGLPVAGSEAAALP